MIVFPLSAFVLVVGVVSSAVNVPCGDGTCNKAISKYYEEINCKPVLEAGACCPASFDCPAASTRVPTQCHLKGVAYNPGQTVNNSLAGNPCTKDCRCEKIGVITKFECASVQCNAALPEGCVGLYEDVHTCCPTSTYCKSSGKIETGEKKAVTCSYEGNTYLENERLPPSPLHPCKTCTCQKFFNGTYDGPWCQDISCDIELQSGLMLQRGCAPIYYGTNGCCPISWRCPADTDTIVPAQTGTPEVAQITHHSAKPKREAPTLDDTPVETKSEESTVETKSDYAPAYQHNKKPKPDTTKPDHSPVYHHNVKPKPESTKPDHAPAYHHNLKPKPETIKPEHEPAYYPNLKPKPEATRPDHELVATKPVPAPVYYPNFKPKPEVIKPDAGLEPTHPAVAPVGNKPHHAPIYNPNLKPNPEETKPDHAPTYLPNLKPKPEPVHEPSHHPNLKPKPEATTPVHETPYNHRLNNTHQNLKPKPEATKPVHETPYNTYLKPRPDTTKPDHEPTSHQNLKPKPEATKPVHETPYNPYLKPRPDTTKPDHEPTNHPNLKPKPDITKPNHEQTHNPYLKPKPDKPKPDHEPTHYPNLKPDKTKPAHESTYHTSHKPKSEATMSDATSANQKTGGQCRFGKLTLALHDQLSSTSEDLECTCSYPPSVTCVQKEVHYNLDFINESRK